MEIFSVPRSFELHSHAGGNSLGLAGKYTIGSELWVRMPEKIKGGCRKGYPALICSWVFTVTYDTAWFLTKYPLKPWNKPHDPAQETIMLTKNGLINLSHTNLFISTTRFVQYVILTANFRLGCILKAQLLIMNLQQVWVTVISQRLSPFNSFHMI